MAEAAIQPAVRYFCHECTQEVSPVLPEYVCSRCHSGFIEELAPPTPQTPTDPDDFYVVSGTLDAIFDPQNSAPGTSTEARWSIPWNQPGQSAGGRRVSVEGLMRGGAPTTQSPDLRNTRAEGFLQQFIQSLHDNTGFFSNSNFPVFVNLHGNPGDYVWGRGGWNAIITQLINQLDGTGPPPLPRDKIDEIPTVTIKPEQVAKNLQCTVCMEDFQLDEPVRLLPCQHNFHENCIIPWLELHGTCPICRKLLSNEMSSTNPLSSQGNESTYPPTSVNYSSLANFSSNSDHNPSDFRDDQE